MTTGWVDEPIVGADEDRLGRLPFADHVAALIDATHRPEASIVYGLSGPWGSGKTSLSNMIIEQLSNRPGDWQIARFTPWATGDVNGMLAEFYRAIAHALPGSKGATKARNALGRVAQIAAPMAEVIPVAGAAASALVKTGGERLLASPPWDVAFQKAANRIGELGVPLLVVVDDIDRLHSEELTALLKVVRLLGRFPGVDYLLAYDNSTVFQALASNASRSEREGTPERFMEKIVQFPLAVPPLLQGQQLRLLNEGLAKAFAATGRAEGADGRLSSLLSSFVSLLTTPRAIERYAAQVRHQLSMLSADEIDDDDLIILTLLRVALPDVFEQLPRYRGELLSGHTDRFADPENRRRDEHFERFLPTALLVDVPERLQRAAVQLILALFPKVKGSDRPTVGHARSGRAISVDAYFDRYFHMSISDSDVSDVDLRRALADAREGDDTALGRMLDTDDTNKLLLVLGKVRAEIAAGPGSPAEMLNLGEAIADRLAGMPDLAHVMFSPRDLATYIVVDMLAQAGQHYTQEQTSALLSRIGGKAMQLGVWSLVGSSLRDRYPEMPQPWYDCLAGQFADAAVIDFIGNLRAGDDAPSDDGVGTQLHFALENGREDAIRARVRQLITDGDLDVETLAARFVPVRRMVNVGATWHLSDEIDQDAYDRVAPADDDPFYHLPPSDFEPEDLTWANRRLAASGRTRRPPEPTPPAPDGPA